MKTLFKIMMDKIEAHFLNRAGIAITPEPKVVFSELKFQKHFSQEFISYNELRRAHDYTDPIESALKKISHRIGEELMDEGFLVIESFETPNRTGISINVIGYFAKPIEETETIKTICKKIRKVLNWP